MAHLFALAVGLQAMLSVQTVLVVSDGGDNASAHQYADGRAMAVRSQAVIYAIGLRGASAEQAPKILRRLAEDTGGVAYFPRSAGDVSEVLIEIVRDLRDQYTLGFAPEDGAHPRERSARSP
ncbi:MAG: hypothetical protein A3F70_02345 [Acidobacteria bacterium RIFCSPLOWO2_12_FULL_67_14]|nr:MAG: hypothetical protein A3F70_02345 [Acidobacteria bacterium RIFCSPLOWO2_12_FULL_67_14]